MVCETGDVELVGERQRSVLHCCPSRASTTSPAYCFSKYISKSYDTTNNNNRHDLTTGALRRTRLQGHHPRNSRSEKQ